MLDRMKEFPLSVLAIHKAGAAYTPLDFEYPKLLVIDEIEILNFDADKMQLTLRIACSKGTYIRALARDIGERLRSGAHLIALRRTRVGDIRIEDCMNFEQFTQLIDNETKSIQI